MKPEELSEYPVSIELQVQWGYMDAFGHVNNVTHFRWFESARVAYLEAIGMEYMISAAGKGLILAAINCNYRRQLSFPDTVIVGARVTRIGNSSLTVAHAIYSTTQRAIVADGDSAVVMFDYESQRSRRVPDDLRAAIARLEGRKFE